MSGKTTIDYKAIENYVQKNPTASYSQFLKATHIKISDCSYYTVRRRITGKSTYTSRKKSNIYISVFKINAAGILPQSKQILEQFVDALNIQNKSKLEVIEYINPAQIEVREMKDF